jgi:hypothetical protein
MRDVRLRRKFHCSVGQPSASQRIWPGSILVHVRFVVDSVAVWQCPPSQYFCFSPVSISYHQCSTLIHSSVMSAVWSWQLAVLLNNTQPSFHTVFFIAEQIIILAATPPNEPHQCILTHFNNCNFSKAQKVCSLRMVFHTETCRSLLMSILMQI